MAKTAQITLDEALRHGPPPPDNLAVPIFRHGSLEVEIYTPAGTDLERPPRLRDLDGLRADELAFELGLTVLKKHGDHLLEVQSQLVYRGTLGVCAGPTRDVPDEQARRWVALDHGRETTHDR